MKRRRVHYGRLLFVIVVVLGIGLGAWKLVTSVLDDNATPSTPVENTNTPAEEETPKSAFAVVDYYHEELEDRYQAYQNAHPDESIENIVTYVNIGIDQPFFTDPVIEVENPDDTGVLINKMYKLPDNYQPSDLVETSQPCIQGQHYSCYAGGTQYLRKEANDHFQELCAHAREEIGINIYAIASFRDYDYQNTLYQYGLDTQGQEYADQYYARPGQSEHQTGLTLDVTFDTWNYNELDQHPQYKWFLEHLAEHGFILRYPEGKEFITGYEHESWHIRYLGVDLSKAVYESGLTYEEFIARGMSA